MALQSTEKVNSHPVVSTSIDALAWNATGTRLAVSVSQLYDGPVPASGFTQIIDLGTNQVLFATDYYGTNVHWIFTEGREDLLIVSALGGIRHYKGDNYQLIREYQNRNDREWYGLISSFMSASDNSIQMHMRHLTDVQEYLIGQNISNPEDTLIVPINTDSAVRMRLNWIGSNPATQVIAGAGSDGLVRVWTEVSQLPTHVIVVSSGDELLSGDFTSDGRFLAVGGRDRCLTIIDTLTYSISAQIETGSTVDRIGWHPDGRQIAIGSSGMIWNVETQTINLQLANDFVTAIAWNSTGQLAAGLHFDHDAGIRSLTDSILDAGAVVIVSHRDPLGK